ncbi:MAG: hypothetical protein ACK5ZS_01575 [bacterium]|jgi:hypothetical protein
MSKHKQDAVEAVEAVEPEQQAVAQPPVEQAEPGYLVVWHVKIAGELHAPGSRIELDDETAAPFLASGAIA